MALPAGWKRPPGGAEYESGQAWVYEVVRPGDDSRYALKRLKNTKRAVRFAREVQVMERLSQAGLAVVPEIVDHDLDAEKPYFVMPWFSEGSLEQVAIDERRFAADTPEALRLLIELVDALAVVHAAQVAHRDLKPANVLLRSGRPIVCDFGLCLEAGDEDQRWTETDEAIGSRLYIAPENEHGFNDEVDQRPCDFYAFGKILWATVSARTPPARERLLDNDFDLVAITGAQALASLKPLLRRLLNPDPRARMVDWPPVREQLRRCLERLDGSSPDGIALPRAVLDVAMRVAQNPAVIAARETARDLSEITVLWSEVKSVLAQHTRTLEPTLAEIQDATDGVFHLTVASGGPNLAEALRAAPHLPSVSGVDLLSLETVFEPGPLVVVSPTDVGPRVPSLDLCLFAGVSQGRLQLVATPLLLTGPQTYAAPEGLSRRYTSSREVELSSLELLDAAAEFAEHRAGWALNAIGDYFTAIESGLDVVDDASWR